MSASSLVAPVINSSPAAIDIGQSSTLTATSPFSGGTSPYTCEWLQMAPGGGSYSPLGSSFSCNVYDLPSVSTGTLSTLGVWSFELQVNDSASESVTSGSVTITVNPDLVAPTISVSPTATGSGQSATLSVITSLADGTSPYTCQWLQESPMNATFVTLGGSFTIGCTTSSKPSISTGTLTTAGNWSFELQVTDAAGETVASSPVRLTVGSLPGTSVTLSCFRSSIVVGSATTCKAKVVGSGSAPTGSVAWSSSSPGVFSRDSCALSRYGTYSTCLVRFKPTAAGSLVVLAANYGGDTNNFPSSGAYNLTVTMKVTKTTVSCSPTFVVAGSSTVVICKAKVFGYLPTGTIGWSPSGTGSVFLSSATCTLTSQVNPAVAMCYVEISGSTGGRVTLTANYMGDSNNQGSSRTAGLTIKKASTVTTISCIPYPFAVNTPITCKGTVTGQYSSHTGTLIFTVSGRSFVSPSNACTLASGSCSVNVTTYARKIAIRGTYSGDTNNRASSGRATLITAFSSVGCGATIQANTILGHNVGPCSGKGLVIGHSGITLNCNGHTITSKINNTHAGIYLIGKTGVTVENCDVTGFEYGFLLNSSSTSNILIGNTANNNAVNGFELSFSSNHNTLTNNTAINNSHFGLLLNSSSHNTLTGNWANNNNASGFYLLDSNSSTLTNNTAINNSHFGLFLNSSSNNILTANTANGDVNGFYLLDSNSSTLTNNTAINNSHFGLFLNSSSNNILAGNWANNNHNASFFIFSSSGNTLTGNRANNNINYGFCLSHSSNNTLIKNTADSSGLDGFWIYSSSHNTLGTNTALTGNMATNSGHYGFEVSGSSNNTLTRNTANDSSLDGFMVRNSSSYNTFTGNIAGSNGNDGFLINGTSSHNTLTVNSAAANHYGFYLFSSSNNTLSENTAESNFFDGFGLYNSSTSNTLAGNIASSNNVGFSLSGSSSNDLVLNTASNNHADGFSLSSSLNNHLIENTASNNGADGFYLSSSSSGNTLLENTANNNGQYGYYDASRAPPLGTNGTANTYTLDNCSGNHNGGSNPSGLGSPQS